MSKKRFTGQRISAISTPVSSRLLPRFRYHHAVMKNTVRRRRLSGLVVCSSVRKNLADNRGKTADY